MGKKIIQGIVYYQVKWEGYNDEDNTWEPEENLSSPDLKNLIV